MTESFFAALRVVIPMIILMSLGYLSRTNNLITRPAMKEFDRMIFKFFMPILLFKNIYEMDFTQGLDCRLLNDDAIDALNRIRLKEIHFAWDSVAESDAVLRGLRQYAARAKRKPHGTYASVYVLTNYASTHEEDLYRVETLRAMGYDPYVMVYDRPSAPAITRQLQRWANNKRIFRTVEHFEDYIPGRIGGKAHEN